ncbi:response regulator [Oscillatoria sp. FACHB-1407]|uniref:hybrid sensor histidine kinase/response regulator n=1 Tax=Oscillatoria sp. FACHB-1407 TaxID=2692847 RepID=UPI001687886D|nr:response regulator [Oscillatoria sp. FACHB-1407]MBD2462665.1 response regulator [Oscillatoria sp. FACHB-1407]
MQKILVIEDEADLREIIIEILELKGFEAIAAENGETGIELAQTELPDLIVCDIMMPELDGYTVLSQLRQLPSTAMIPFIFLTAKGTVDDFRAGMRLGADDYLTKPFRHTELIDAITTRLARQSTIQNFQRELVQQLQQKVDELQQENSIKEDFLSTASHELRSPMTNIRLAIQMLQTMPQNTQQQRYIDLLQTECGREIDLLNDLLDLQQLESNFTPPAVGEINLHDFITSVAQSFEERMIERQQTFQVSINSDISSISFNASDLRRILSELLHNACKYTAPHHNITLSVQGNDPIQIVVSNEAEIPAQDLPYLFDRFYRVRSLDRWQQGGTGLGLALIKRLVERAGGTIQVTSSDGWTRFCVEIPIL